MPASSHSFPDPTHNARVATLSWEWNAVRPGHRFPRHAHTDWSVAVVCAGAGFFHTGGTLHEARPGAITVLHPGESHRSWVHPEEGLDYLVITIPQNLAARLLGCRATSFFPHRVIDDPECAAALLTASETADGTYRSVGNTAAELAVALARLFQSHARGGGPTMRRSSLVRTLVAYLDDHYAFPLSLNDMASLAHVSPATLVRHFHADLGMAPHEYLVSRRIDAARALIRSDRPLSEVAPLSGFADQSHLHRHFNRIVGVTPGRFRRAVGGSRSAFFVREPLQ